MWITLGNRVDELRVRALESAILSDSMDSLSKKRGTVMACDEILEAMRSLLKKERGDEDPEEEEEEGVLDG